MAPTPDAAGPSAPGLTVHDWGGPTGTGTGQVVLLHGLTDSGRCWPDAVRRWTRSHRVLSWDARGHGTSPRFTPEERRAMPWRVMADDAVRLLESLRAAGSGPVALVGHSMGGATAALVAAQRPDLVRAVVLEDPALGRPLRCVEPESDEDLAERGRGWLEESRGWALDPGAAEAAGRAETAWPAVEYPEWATAKTQVDHAMLATGDIRPRAPWVEVLRAVRVPTLLVRADDRTRWSRADRAAIAELDQPLVEAHVVAGAGHCVRRDRPQAFHALVDPWLRARLR